MKARRPSGWLGALLLGLTACGSPGQPSSSGTDGDPREAYSGGDMTVFDHSRDAFARPAPNLRDDFETTNRFFVGNSFFNQNWVTAPSSTQGRDGLGPTYNATSCSACHFKDGRGAPPQEAGEEFLGLLLRLSVPGTGPNGGGLPEPTYGGQFNHRAINGVAAEGTSRVEYTERPGAYPDGTAFSLRQPRYVMENLAYGAMAADVMVSPRVAPASFGLGLLEAVAEQDIVANADPEDSNGDGIRGQANHVWDAVRGQVSLGRFGWKSNVPSLKQQNAGAFVGDIGITTDLFPTENCPATQSDCQAAPNGGTPEADADLIEDVTLYTQTLAVPARRNVHDPQVRRGKDLFAQVGCTGCHIEHWLTSVVEGLPEVSQQDIRPYTDLLVHDMGPELADNRPDGQASGTQWRTAPLWGLGLVQTVNRHLLLLHDGRARGMEEAILWHGGEGQPSRDRFMALDAAGRQDLLTFLESL